MASTGQENCEGVAFSYKLELFLRGKEPLLPEPITRGASKVSYENFWSTTHVEWRKADASQAPGTKCHCYLGKLMEEAYVGPYIWRIYCENWGNSPAGALTGGCTFYYHYINFWLEDTMY